METGANVLKMCNEGVLVSIGGGQSGGGRSRRPFFHTIQFPVGFLSHVCQDYERREACMVKLLMDLLVIE
jgi:hypothetical protein